MFDKPGEFYQFTPDTIKSLRDLIVDVVKTEVPAIVRKEVSEHLKENPHTCRFHLDDKDASEINHGLGVLSALGEGKISKGIEVIRDNHKWMKTQRERSQAVGTAFLIVLATSMVGGVLTAIWWGVKAKITGTVAP